MSDHFRSLGSRGPNDPPLLDEKYSNFETRLEVFGWVLDTGKLTVSMNLRKLETLQRLLGEWPVSRQTATFRQVHVWVDGCSLACVVCYAAREVLRRPVADCDGNASIGRISAWFGQLKSNRRVTLRPMFYSEHEFLEAVCGQRACPWGGALFIAHVQYCHSSTTTNDVHGLCHVDLRRVLPSDGSVLPSRTVSRRAVLFSRFEQTLYWF